MKQKMMPLNLQFFAEEAGKDAGGEAGGAVQEGNAVGKEAGQDAASGTEGIVPEGDGNFVL